MKTFITNTLCKNKSILFFAFLLFCFIHHPLNAATMVFDDGLESGNLTNYKTSLNGGTFTVTTSPVKTGKYSGKFNLSYAKGNYRAEAVTTNNRGNFNFETEYWFSFDYLYQDWAKDTLQEMAPFQIHNRYKSWTSSCQFGAAGANAPFGMVSKDDEVKFVTFGGITRWKASIQKQNWQEITVHFRISSGSTGFIEAWKDGVKLFRVDGANSFKVDKCGNPLLSPYLKIGLYKPDWKSKLGTATNRTLLVDNLNIAQGSNAYSMVTSTSTANATSPTISISSSSTASTNDAGLVAYWPMNIGTGTTTQDISGNDHTATLVNGAQLGSDGAHFDGVDDYLNAGIFPLAGKAMTMSAWIWSNNINNCRKRACTFVAKSAGTGTQNKDIQLSTIKKRGKTRLRFRLNVNGATSTLTAKAGDVEENSWVHVTAVFNGKKMSLYQNGVLVGRKAVSGHITPRNKFPISIGGNAYDASVNPWSGVISDVRLFNYALSKDEVAELAK